MVAAPAAGRLEGPPAGNNRASGHELFDDLAVDTGRPAGGLEVDVAARHRDLRPREARRVDELLVRGLGAVDLQVLRPRPLDLSERPDRAVG
jgi:hypothetical protein